MVEGKGGKVREKHKLARKNYLFGRSYQARCKKASSFAKGVLVLSNLQSKLHGNWVVSFSRMTREGDNFVFKCP